MMTFLRSAALKKWHVLLVLIILASSCAPIRALTCPPIKIGVVLNGTDTTANDEQNQGYKQAVDEINAKGIGQGCKIELIYSTKSQDSQTDNPQQDVQDLTAQGAVALIAPSTNDAAQLVANMAGYFDIPVIVPSDAGDEITPANNLWVYRITPTMSSYAHSTFAMITAAGSSSSSDVAIFYESSDYGQSAAVAFGNAAVLNNMNVAIYQGYSTFLQDFGDLKTALTSKNPGVVVVISTQPGQAAAIYQMIKSVQSSQGSQSNIQYVIGDGSGFWSNSFLYDSTGALNQDLEGLILDLPWAGNSSQASDLNCSDATQPETQVGAGQPLNLRVVQSEVSLNLLASALQKVTQIKSWTVDKTTITDWRTLLRSAGNLPTFRQSLAQAIPEVQGCQFGNVLWPVKFNTSGQNQIAPLLVKIEGGNFVTLYPQR